MGSWCLTITDAGTNPNNAIEVAGVNSYTGGTWVDTGLVNVTNISSFGSGAVTLTGGSLSTFTNTPVGNFAIANPIILNNSVVTLSAADNGNNFRTFFTGPITLIGNNQRSSRTLVNR